MTDTPTTPTEGDDTGGRWVIQVTIPSNVPGRDRLFTAVADAAHDWEPENRDGWDIDVSAGPVAWKESANSYRRELLGRGQADDGLLDLDAAVLQMDLNREAYMAADAEVRALRSAIEDQALLVDTGPGSTGTYSGHDVARLLRALVAPDPGDDMCPRCNRKLADHDLATVAAACPDPTEEPSDRCPCEHRWIDHGTAGCGFSYCACVRPNPTDTGDPT